MRTTLKRGIGRAAAGNGNGRAVLPPTILGGNGASPQVSRYRQPPPPNRSTGRLIGAVFGWIFLGLIVVVAGLAGGLYLYGHETLGALSPNTPEAKATSKDVTPIASPSEPATALLIGYDTRMGADATAGQSSRSDTIMLVRADPTNRTLSMLSFPRDLIVPIYCNGSEVPRTQDRINVAWTLCGERGTLDTVQHLTGVDVNYVVTVDFHGFKLLVNKLHGVYMDVDHYYLNTHGGPGGYATIDIQPGYQKLDGQDALSFVRFRHTDSDLYRLARQQLFLQALKDRVATSLSIFQIPQIIGAIKGSVQIVKAGGSPVGVPEIQSYAGLAYHLPAGHLFRNSIQNLVDCGVSGAEVCAQPSDVQAAVDSFENPDLTLPTRANDAALGRKPAAPKEPRIKPADVSTLVLNGTQVPGLARDTSYKLALAGYHTVQLPSTVLADAPTQDYVDTTIYYDPVQQTAKAAAGALQKSFGPPAKVEPMDAAIGGFAQQAQNPLTVVVVGSSFSGTLVNPEAHTQPTPPPTPPAVRTDPGLTLEQLQGDRGKVPFRLLLPHAIERSSTLAALDPVRVFKPIAYHKELVLTFVTGAGNVYWQVIETDWNDAPILSHPTGHANLGGRRADLYTTGGNIHMVVLHGNGASYWVVNTLRDELSNETMLAIARGLQPLGK